MKKYIKLTAMVVTISVAGLITYKSQKKEHNVSHLVTMNIEAIAGIDFPEYGPLYTICSTDCPEPFWYKRSVSCEPHGWEECSSSDCY